jgi:DNA-directed RNA polymerase subunit RPC12/RpoP
MIYKCPRCGFETGVNTNFKKHIINKIICNPIIADISLDDIKDEAFNKKINNIYDCKGCNKKYSSPKSLSNHMKICKNPQKIIKKNDINDDINDDNSVLKTLKTDKDIEIERLKLELMYYKNKNNENYYQKFLETILGGCHRRLKCGITDITTDKFHAEIKNWKDWKEAIGQLICYNKHDKKSEMRLYLFGSCKDEKLKMIYEDCKSFDINVYNIVNNKNDTFSICNMNSSEVNIYKASGELII